MADQFAQLVGGDIRQPGHGRALLGAEAGNAQHVDGIGLGALQILAGKAAGAQRIEQRDRVAARRQRGEQVAPVMPGRLHRHQEDRRLAEQGEQLGIARRILGNLRRFDGDRAVGGHCRDHVTVRSDIDTDIVHTDPDLLIRQGASPQASTLTLVHARTTDKAAPPDTVRARDTGRGRRSYARGWCLNPVPTTSPSRRSTANIGRPSDDGTSYNPAGPADAAKLLRQLQHADFVADDLLAGSSTSKWIPAYASCSAEPACIQNKNN